MCARVQRRRFDENMLMNETLPHTRSAHKGSRWAVKQATRVAAIPLGIQQPLRSTLVGLHAGIHMPVGIGGCGCVGGKVRTV